MINKKVVIKKLLDAPIEKVFDAWIDPLYMQQWYSPENMTTPHAEIDLRIGGSYSVTMRYKDPSSSDGMTVRGVYKEIQKPTKLRFSWQWDGQEDITEVTVLLRAISERETELTLIHAGFKDKFYEKGFTKADHSGGWTSAFNKLEAFLKETNLEGGDK